MFESTNLIRTWTYLAKVLMIKHWMFGVSYLQQIDMCMEGSWKTFAASFCMIGSSLQCSYST